jgi:hypothetical protein
LLLAQLGNSGPVILEDRKIAEKLREEWKNKRKS